jgi:MoaA/NifB/PqqE/SkfB family radical SAM enzyme
MAFGLYLEITNRCNLQCLTCLTDSGTPRAREMDHVQISGLLKKLYLAGAESIFYTGGEPLLKERFIDILDDAGTLGYRQELTTNGTVVTDKLVDAFLRNRTTVNVSIDGSNALVNDRIRGAGAFSLATSAIERLTTAKLRTRLVSVVHGGNSHQLVEIGKLARDLGCCGVVFSEVLEGGRARRNWDDLVLSSSMRAIIAEAIEVVRRDIFEDSAFISDETCWVDGDAIYLNAQGDAYLCSEISQCNPAMVVGNVIFGNEEPTQLILRSLKNCFAHLRCCYRISASEHVTFIETVSIACPVAQLNPAAM